MQTILLCAVFNPHEEPRTPTVDIASTDTGTIPVQGPVEARETLAPTELYVTADFCASGLESTADTFQELVAVTLHEVSHLASAFLLDLLPLPYQPVFNNEPLKHESLLPARTKKPKTPGLQTG
jgi:hypothetical protein